MQLELLVYYHHFDLMLLQILYHSSFCLTVLHSFYSLLKIIFFCHILFFLFFHFLFLFYFSSFILFTSNNYFCWTYLITAVSPYVFRMVFLAVIGVRAKTVFVFSTPATLIVT